MTLFDPTLRLLERALDARLLRHNVLAGNLANVDTPGFVPRELDFAAALRDGAGSARPEPPAPAAVPVPRSAMTFVSAGHPVEVAPLPRAPELPLAGPRVGGPGSQALVTARGASPGLDGNAVDADRALVAVAENAVQYEAAARAAQKKLAMLRYAASDGAA